MLAIAVAVLLLMGASGPGSDNSPSRAPVTGTMVTAPDGISCRLGAPYVSGGGPRPGYVFDERCHAVLPANR